MSDIRRRASFDFIRYSNCWEDADVLIAGLDLSPGGRVLSIASAGDNTLSLLTCDPEIVVAVDLNPAQLALLELKVAVFRRLEYAETLRFLGFTTTEAPWREEVYRAIREGLSAGARSFWDTRYRLIDEGVVHAGKFERYFSIFRRRILPLVHGKRDVMTLLAPKSIAEQERFYRETWDTWRWRAMFRFFFSRFVMGRLGRDPEMFRFVHGSVADRILARTRHALTAIPVHDNPYVNFILNGGFGNALPHYARPENYERIRRNLDALRLLCGTTDDAIREFPVRYNGMNLSDIFEYMTEAETAEVGERLGAASQSGGRLVNWNMLAPRRLSAIVPARMRRLDPLSERLFAEDRAFFYQALHIDEVQ